MLLLVGLRRMLCTVLNWFVFHEEVADLACSR